MLGPDPDPDPDPDKATLQLASGKRKAQKCELFISFFLSVRMRKVPCEKLDGSFLGIWGPTLDRPVPFVCSGIPSHWRGVLFFPRQNWIERLQSWSWSFVCVGESDDAARNPDERFLFNPKDGLKECATPTLSSVPKSDPRRSYGYNDPDKRPFFFKLYYPIE